MAGKRSSGRRASRRCSVGAVSRRWRCAVRGRARPRWSARPDRPGVFDADFDVHRGEIFVVIGLSGSGKSTLLRLINRLIEPTEGEVYLDEYLVSKMPMKQVRDVRRKKMGMVFQHFGLLPNRSVLDNITFGLEIQGVSKEERRKR